MSCHFISFHFIYLRKFNDKYPSLFNYSTQLIIPFIFSSARLVRYIFIFLGGLLFGIFGKRTNRYGRDPIVFLGFVIHIITFYLIYLNIPNHAPIGETFDDTPLHNKYVFKHLIPIQTLFLVVYFTAMEFCKPATDLRDVLVFSVESIQELD